MLVMDADKSEVVEKNRHLPVGTDVLGGPFKRINPYTTGTDKAERLAALLDDCELYDAEFGTPYVVDVDTVIIGSYIHMGTVNSGVKRFIVQNGKELLNEKINVGLFICSAVLEQADDVIEANFPRFLLEKACAISSFGGRLGSENLSGMDRLIAKKFEKLYRKNGGQPPVILDRVIERFADEILRAETGESSSIDTIPESAE